MYQYVWNLSIWGTTLRFHLQLKHEQDRSSELESTLLNKIEEHDQLDAQFQAEHEEEVRALRQQKQQLARQIEEIKTHYEQLMNNQDKQVHNVLTGYFKGSNFHVTAKINLSCEMLECLSMMIDPSKFLLPKQVVWVGFGS